jgi:hypothetical protein
MSTCIVLFVLKEIHDSPQNVFARAEAFAKDGSRRKDTVQRVGLQHMFEWERKISGDLVIQFDNVRNVLVSNGYVNVLLINLEYFLGLEMIWLQSSARKFESLLNKVLCLTNNWRSTRLCTPPSTSHLHWIVIVQITEKEREKNCCIPFARLTPTNAAAQPSHNLARSSR